MDKKESNSHEFVWIWIRLQEEKLLYLSIDFKYMFVQKGLGQITEANARGFCCSISIDEIQHFWF